MVYRSRPRRSFCHSRRNCWSEPIVQSANYGAWYHGSSAQSVFNGCSWNGGSQEAPLGAGRHGNDPDLVADSNCRWAVKSSLFARLRASLLV